MGLPQRGRIYATHSKFEMLLSYGHSFKDFCINFFSLNIDYIHFLSNTLKS